MGKALDNMSIEKELQELRMFSLQILHIFKGGRFHETSHSFIHSESTHPEFTEQTHI